MPTIPLSGSSDDGALLLSYMYFPRHEHDREALFTALRVEPEMLPLPAAPGAAVFPASAQREAVRLAEAGWRGTVAGEILHCIALMQSIEEPEPSFRKALRAMHIHAVGLITDDQGRIGDAREDKAVPVTEKSFWNFLSKYRYKDVAHFWAAHRVLERAVPFYRIPEELRQPDQLNIFLGHAAWFLDLGLKFSARNFKAREGWIDAATAWVPSTVVTALEPELGEVPSYLREALDSYEAH